MPKINAEDFLAHYGVLGMKWGVRKDRRASTPSSDAARAKRLRARVQKHGTRNLTNKELKDLNYRRELEKNYKKQYPNKLQTGYNFVVGSLAVAGTGVAIFNLLNSPAGKTGVSYLRRLLAK